MRFTARPGTDPIAVADGVLLRALGLPSGGIVRIGKTHVQIRPGAVPGTDIRLGDRAMANTGATPGAIVDVTRAVLADAEAVELDPSPADIRAAIHALQGQPVTPGDTVRIDESYATGSAAKPNGSLHRVVSVNPGVGGVVRGHTRFGREDAPADAAEASEPELTTTSALLAGLEAELELMTGWLSLLADAKGTADKWGLPAVAGLMVEGPAGCGRSELVHAAADAAGTRVVAVDVTTVFKPDRLLDRLSGAVTAAVAPQVIFVDHIDAVAGHDALSSFRTQYLAVIRWFLDAVAEKPGVACVLGSDRASALDPSIRTTHLLPRTLTIPPPDLERRTLLFEAALGAVPSADLDSGRLASLAAGFSGADVIAAVLHASAMAAGAGAELTQDQAEEAVRATNPSLGGVPMG